MLVYIFSVVQLFAALPFAAVAVPPLPVWGVFFMYTVLGAAIFVLYKKQKPPAGGQAV
jgi:hypothetical protein